MNENIINMTIKIFIMNILTFLINWKIFSRNLRKLDILEIIVASSIITVGYIYCIYSSIINNENDYKR